MNILLNLLILSLLVIIISGAEVKIVNLSTVRTTTSNLSTTTTSYEPSFIDESQWKFLKKIFTKILKFFGY